VWGGLHGLYLVINHSWHALRRYAGFSERPSPTPIGRLLGMALTFPSVVVAWVCFRAETFESAGRVLRAMFSYRTALPTEAVRGHFLLPPDSPIYVTTTLALGLALVWLAPNTQTLVANVSLRERPGLVLTGFTACMVLVLAAIAAARGSAEFIYFNF
jgi:hypothetical protein